MFGIPRNGDCNQALQPRFCFCPFLAPCLHYLVRMDKVPTPAKKVR
nr:MAG TPA: hypothetical protein [Caudoviricetes sp.]